MGRQGGVLLTGATGFLGRYLLRDLLAAGTRVAVLVRPDRAEPVAERVRAVHEFACATLGRRVPAPDIYAGDLCAPNLGLGAADGGRLARTCGSVVHAAASLSFRPTADGEPHRTNTRATRTLFERCAGWGIREAHHVSTAFVCGDRPGPILEAETDCGQAFHNDYERSKLAAELAARQVPGLRTTVYRPSVIVGDSRTGHTSSYQGVYRFLELAHRLARPGGPSGRLRLPLRLPFRGDEPRNLVPVDWVAAAIVRLVGRPEGYGRTYHLTAAQPTPVSDLRTAAVEDLGLEGIEFVPAPPERSPLERAFLDALRDYWPYLGGDPVFDCRNTRAALPDLPPPPVDRACLGRLVRFAVADGWGKRRRRAPEAGELDCGDYIERFFPERIGRSPLARVPIETTLSFDIRGAGGGRWLCRLGGGRVLQVTRGAAQAGDVEYRMAVGTFAALVAGRESPQSAFAERRVEIAGGIEKGLALAALFGQFVRAFPYPAAATAEVAA